MKNQKREVILRVQSILAKSIDWSAWQGALEAELDLRQLSRLNLELIYCVDTSELVEYLFPGSLALGSDRYPTMLDLALLILVRVHPTVLILPPHLREFRSLSGAWAERLQQASKELSATREALELFENNVNMLNKQQAQNGGEEFLRFITEKFEHFGLFLGASSRGSGAFDELLNRLRVPDRELLRLPDWTYRPDLDAVGRWYDDLIELKVGSPASSRTDAHVLHMLELLNQELPPGRLLILLTHSGRIWKSIESRRKKEGESRSGVGGTLIKDGVSLVQRPELILVKKLLTDPDREVSQEELVKECERNRGLARLRSRLESAILPYLKSQALGKEDIEEIETLISDLEKGLSSLEFIWQDRWRLEGLRLALEPSRNGRIFDGLSSLEEFSKENLMEALKIRIGDIITNLEELQRKLSLAALVAPETSLSFEYLDDTPAFWMSGILRSKSGGPPMILCFQSKEVKDHLGQIQERLRRLDDAPSTERKPIQLDLQKAMYDCEVRLRHDPEYYLLLASVYSSRQLWFQAYDAAGQGLKELEENHNTAVTVPNLTVTQAELLVAKAWALKNWTLDHAVKHREVAQSFFTEALGCARASLRLQESLSAPGVRQPYRDARCLRIMANIYGEAREEHIDLAISDEDRALGNLGEGEEVDLLDVFVALAQKALHYGKDEPLMRAYYKNSLLYALTERDLVADLAQESVVKQGYKERDRLARELRDEERAVSDPNILDTLAWHHYALARRSKQSSKDLKKAKLYIAAAEKALRVATGDSRKYYKSLIAGHRKSIEDFGSG
ncbi:MAG: hypothetical protein M3O15_00840 [Acidobacteriota bacterium]|nr:hypothetical protein [Acidobacteriota bacterium]